MPKRVTMEQLEAVVRRINDITGNPIHYSDPTTKEFVPLIGNYHLDSAYDGWALYQNVEGGERDVLGIGHASKRELLSHMFSYIRGLNDGLDKTRRS